MICPRSHFRSEVVKYYVLLGYTILLPVLAQPLSISHRLHTTYHSNIIMPAHRPSNDEVAAGAGLREPHLNILVSSRNYISTKIVRRARSLKLKQRNYLINNLQAGSNRTVKIWCFCGYNLAIKDDGGVGGVLTHTGDNVLFNIESYGKKMFALKSLKLGRYIAMNSKGNLYSTKHFSDEVMFKLVNDHIYTQFASNKYFKHKRFDMLLGIRKNGKPQKGQKTSPRKRATKFAVLRVL